MTRPQPPILAGSFQKVPVAMLHTFFDNVWYQPAQLPLIVLAYFTGANIVAKELGLGIDQVG